MIFGAMNSFMIFSFHWKITFEVKRLHYTHQLALLLIFSQKFAKFFTL